MDLKIIVTSISGRRLFLLFGIDLILKFPNPVFYFILLLIICYIKVPQ